MNKTILEEAARRFGTPCYVISAGDFARRANTVKEAFGENTGLCYSIKANPFLLKYLPDAFSYIEVCSPGELSICEELSVPMSKVIFSGVNKTERDVERAWNDGVGLFTAESLLHVQLINDRAVRSGGKARLILRLSHGSQFGMDASVIKEVIRNRDSYKGLEIVGLHYFTGTQKTKVQTIRRELSLLDEFCQELESELGFRAEHIEYGTGLAVEYFKDFTEETDMALLAEAAEAVREFAGKYPLTVEMGRFFAAESGSYLTSVMDVKTNGDATYVICDGGINQLNYYGQNMAMKVPPISVLNKPEGSERADYCLCGSLCTTADILVRKAELPKLEIGDVICFSRCGAYSISEGIAIFLSRSLPNVALYSEKDGLTLSRQITETYPLNKP